MNCTICGAIDPKDVRHLDLYVIGSEGIEVCTACRMRLTDFARTLMNTTRAAYLRGYRTAMKEAKTPPSVATPQPCDLMGGLRAARKPQCPTWYNKCGSTYKCLLPEGHAGDHEFPYI